MTNALPPGPLAAPGANPSHAGPDRLLFVGGGNMASAIVGGLVEQARGRTALSIEVIEPHDETRTRLAARFGIGARARSEDADLAGADIVVWAVKPQVFRDAAIAARGAFAPKALHLSVAAGIRSDTLCHWLDTTRVVRAMPNTPALIGRGVTGLYARPEVDAAARERAAALLAVTGETLWLDAEAQLDAVTALSGSGPAYVFYFLEAMVAAGESMGLAGADARRLAVATFAGAAELAGAAGTESLATLRERVTSKGGTTDAALKSLAADRVAESFARAMEAARARAVTLGDEFGA